MISFLKMMTAIVILFLTFSISAETIYQPINSVLGDWRTIDEHTHKPSSIISIYSQGDKVSGKIIHTFPQPGVKHITHCQSCSDDRRNQPILGLEIIRNMECRPLNCSGGTILDPRNGKLYRATLTLIDGGHLLKVRGFIGISLFGKTVIWERASSKMLSS